jgi:hypothetical protein
MATVSFFKTVNESLTDFLTSFEERKGDFACLVLMLLF